MSRSIAAKLVLAVALALLLDGALAQCSASKPCPKGYYNALAANRNHTTMINMVSANTMYKNLLNTAPLQMTVFAPTDKAFAAAMAKYGINANAALKSANLFNNVLMYHVVQRQVITSQQLTQGASLPTMKMVNGSPLSLRVSISNGKPIIKGIGSSANIVKKDQFVGYPNDATKTLGVIHDINAVLLPSKDAASLL